MQKSQFRSGAEFYHGVCRDFFPQRQLGIGFAGNLHDDADGVGFGRPGGSPNQKAGKERKREAVSRPRSRSSLSALGGGEGRGEGGGWGIPGRSQRPALPSLSPPKGGEAQISMVSFMVANSDKAAGWLLY